jgi:hypothetical protein
MQDNANAAIRDLPGGFRAGQAAADDVYEFRRGRAYHAAQVARFVRKWNALVEWI